MMAEFSTEVRHDDGAGIIDLHGDLDGHAEGALDRAWEQLSASPPEVLVLHFGDVGYVNSTGIALIVGLLARARETDTPVRAVGLTDHYRHIFEITRLADFMTIVTNDDAAIDGSATPA